MNIQENISLRPYNSFGIDQRARYFLEVNTVQEVIMGIKKARDLNQPVFVIGGGSNILLTKDLEAFVIWMKIKGISVVREDKNSVWVKVGAGEIWHDFVLHCISLNWYGVENLSLIPGTVGASPMQNIGAYGAELREVFVQLEAINRQTMELETFDLEQCRFGYRESIFKNTAKNQYIITHVQFKLGKKASFNISYGAIQQTLEYMEVGQLSLQAISDAVIHIRKSKLPDPRIVGNAGSFFKNPLVSTDFFDSLKKKLPDLPGFAQTDGVKIPAAWLLERAGWKGKTFGNIGVHQNQPLVLVNYGKGDGKSIEKLSKKIQKDIYRKFKIRLQTEVNII